MIIVSGFPNDEVMNLDTKIDFEIIVFKDFDRIFEEKLHTQMEHDKIRNIILSIQKIIELNREGQEFVLGNLIEFIIWFDKKANYDKTVFLPMIKEYADMTELPNLLNLIINNPIDIKNYQLEYLVDNFRDLEFHAYNDATFILMLKELCKIYNRNYQEDVLYILKRYLSEKAVQEIANNFDKFDENILVNIIGGHLTRKNIQIELDNINFLMKLAILNEEK